MSRCHATRQTTAGTGNAAQPGTMATGNALEVVLQCRLGEIVRLLLLAHVVHGQRLHGHGGGVVRHLLQHSVGVLNGALVLLVVHELEDVIVRGAHRGRQLSRALLLRIGSRLLVRLSACLDHLAALMKALASAFRPVPCSRLGALRRWQMTAITA